MNETLGLGTRVQLEVAGRNGFVYGTYLGRRVRNNPEEVVLAELDGTLWLVSERFFARLLQVREPLAQFTFEVENASLYHRKGLREVLPGPHFCAKYVMRAIGFEERQLNGQPQLFVLCEEDSKEMVGIRNKPNPLLCPLEDIGLSYHDSIQ